MRWFRGSLAVGVAVLLPLALIAALVLTARADYTDADGTVWHEATSGPEWWEEPETQTEETATDPGSAPETLEPAAPEAQAPSEPSAWWDESETEMLTLGSSGGAQLPADKSRTEQLLMGILISTSMTCGAVLYLSFRRRF